MIKTKKLFNVFLLLSLFWSATSKQPLSKTFSLTEPLKMSQHKYFTLHLSNRNHKFTPVDYPFKFSTCAMSVVLFFLYDGDYFTATKNNCRYFRRFPLPKPASLNENEQKRKLLCDQCVQILVSFYLFILYITLNYSMDEKTSNKKLKVKKANLKKKKRS